MRDRAVDQVLELIITRDLGSGERLPAERELCEFLGVSRTVVREALNLLEARGILEIEHGRGAVVSGSSTRAVRGTLEMMLRVRPRSLGELLEIRNILEVEIAGLAAERAGREDIRELRGAQEKLRARLDTPEGYIEADVEFHALLARSTQNEVLLLMLEPVVELLKASRQVSTSLPGAVERALREHESILECVIAGRVEGARSEMRSHLASTAEDLRWATGGKVPDPPVRWGREESGSEGAPGRT